MLCEKPEIEDALELIKKNQSCSVQGRGGCSKTYFVKNIVCPVMDKLNLKYHKIAFTNKAARLIGGETFHTFVNIN